MLIRSQDKRVVLNIDSISGIACEKKKFIEGTAYILYTEQYILADYSTEEQAIKVLDAMLNQYERIKEAEFLGCENAFYQDNVFQCPSDEEEKV